MQENATAPAGENQQPLQMSEDEMLAGAKPENVSVMIVDDEAFNIKVVQTHLGLVGYQNFIGCTEPRQAIKLMTELSPDVVLLDIMMPEISGLDILRMMRNDPNLKQTPVLVLTASDSEQTKIDALELGAVEFLNKPVNAAELILRLRNVLQMKAQRDRLKHYSEDLEKQVWQRTAELAASRLELVYCLARTAEYRDNETGRHVIRVGRYAGVIARQLGLNPREVELIEHAAPLHDMGKIGIPDEILLKTDKLTPDEFEIMQKHSAFGKRTFEPMSDDEWKSFKSHTVLGEMIMDVESSPLIQMASKIALTHHEWWDGTGYPLGLAGEDIPLAGRITAVADVFDALTSKRPYKPAFPLNQCFEIMQEERGTHFDPRVFDAFMACRQQIIDIRMELADVT